MKNYFLLLVLLAVCSTGSFAVNGVSGKHAASPTEVSRTVSNIPNNTSPENESISLDKSVTFSWTGFAKASSYQIEISSSPNFQNIVYSKASVETQSSVSLEPGIYYWHIRSVSDTGPGAWSSTWTLTVNTNPVPVVFWQFEEAAGNVVTDKYGHVGKVHNARINQPGKVGKAVSLFGGTTEAIFSDYVLPLTNNFTMLVWVKPFVLPQNNAVIAMDGSGSNGWGISIGGIGGTAQKNSNLWVVHGGYSWLDTGYTFASTGVWYHVAYVRHNGIDSFYIDGIKAGLDFSGGTVSQPANIGIGRMPTGFEWSPAFNGSIDELMIYNMPLPSAFIHDIYLKSSGKKQ